jgi:hypothetical protein
MLSCGHPCYGIKNERQCPPCLHPECEATAETMGVHQTAENECNICFSEDLGQAPCIVLDCRSDAQAGAKAGAGAGQSHGNRDQGKVLRHVFHYECIQKKLRSGWNGAAIDFAFLKCPLCEARIDHPACAALLAPHVQLESKVRSKALERLKFEGLDQDKAIVERGGRFECPHVGFRMVCVVFLFVGLFFSSFECLNPSNWRDAVVVRFARPLSETLVFQTQALSSSFITCACSSWPRTSTMHGCSRIHDPIDLPETMAHPAGSLSNPTRLLCIILHFINVISACNHILPGRGLAVCGVVTLFFLHLDHS